MSRRWIVEAVALGVFLLLFSSSAAQAQCNQSCHVCLLNNPFGGCAVEGNDPICEAKKAACPVINAIPGGPIIAGPILGPITTVDECLNNLGNCPNSIINQVPPAQLAQTCLSDIAKCPENVLKSIPALAIQPIIQQYITSLRNQASGQWKYLPNFLTEQFQKSYPEVSLKDVKYATGINTTHGQAITIGNEIFFPGDVDVYNRTGLMLMLHELEHVVQYRRKGGIQPFLSEYILHSAGKIIEKRSFNVHDELNIENDAIAKSKNEINKYGWDIVIDNKCNRLLTVTIYYTAENDNLTIRQYDVKSLEEIWASHDGLHVHTTSTPFYWYAVTKDASGPKLVWSGSHMLPINSRQYPFGSTEISDNDERAEVSFKCT